jgi:hypothetical protein
VSLEDRLTKKVTVKICAFQRMVEAMPKADRVALDKARENGIAQEVIYRALKAEGYKTSKDAITAHKLGECCCPK